MEEYIKDSDFKVLLEDIIYKLSNNQLGECQSMLQQMVDDSQSKEKYIDRTYLGNVREKKKLTCIDEVTSLLKKMSMEQIENVHKYAKDELDEPNHEAEALNAIIQLRKKMQEKEA